MPAVEDGRLPGEAPPARGDGSRLTVPALIAAGRLRRLAGPFLDFLASLRGRQLLLLVTALLPAILLLGYVTLEARREQVRRALAEAELLARVVAEEQRSVIVSTRQLLEVLAHLPEVLDRDPSACNVLFANLVRQEPVFTNLGTVDADGAGLCSGVPPEEPVSAAERSWFKRLKEGGAFVLGDYQIGAVTGEPSMVAALPVYDQQGQLDRVLTASLSLQWLARLVAQIELPAAATVTLVDGDGFVLAQVPRRNVAPGQLLPSAALREAVLGRPGGSLELPAGELPSRLAGFAQVPDAPLHAIVSWSRATALASLEHSTQQLLIALAIAELVILLGVFWAGRAFLLRPVEKLSDAASRLAAGDLSARSGIARDDSDELSRLALVFDRMAEQLQQRQEALQRGEARAQALLRDAIDSAADGIALWDRDDRLVLCNRRYNEFFPATAELMRPGVDYGELCRRWAISGAPGVPETGSEDSWIEARVRQRRERAGTPTEWQLENGRWVMVTDHPAAEGGILTIFSDVTERRQAEAAVRESRERLRAALAASSTGTFRWDFATGLVDADESLSALFGFAAATGPRPVEAFTERLDPEDREHVATAIRESMRAGGDADFEFRVLVPGAGLRWLGIKSRTLLGPDGRAVYMTGACTDLTRQKRTEEQLRLLLAELSHRVKNTLAAVQSIAQHTLRRSATFTGFREAFTGRLAALADVHTLLVQSEWRSCELRDVVEQPLMACRSAGSSNVVLNGPELTLTPRAALCLSLVVHELTTNALKYGALSVPDGQVHLSWRLMRREGRDQLQLRWRERGGPPVDPPEQSGFGTTLIERSVSYELDGEARLTFAPDGLVCAIMVPWAEVRGEPGQAPHERAGRPTAAA